ncbi:MAG: aspartate kinase [Ruminiclostridium sp.]|nr:aspartate kinase [Ruminiclostridium sp.]
MKVVKFGGTSLATADQIRKVCKIVASDPDRRLVVVSAPGKRFREDIKVTDMLIACAKAKLEKGNAEKELSNIINRFSDIAADLGMSKDIANIIATDLKARIDGDTSNKSRFMDSLKAAGEDNCARLVAAYLRGTGVEASYVSPADAGLLLSDEFGNAQVLPQSYANLKSLKNLPGITIFPGFFGYSIKGEVVTLPRGGSDITGSILAAAVEADLYENFTDVDNVYSVNPNLISNPRPIHELTYREMRELSYAGFSVFHEEALVPVFMKGIPVSIKNTNNPGAPGTTILKNRENITDPVVGIASESGFCFIYMSKYLMNREVGFGRKILTILEDECLSYEHIPSGIDNISIILRQDRMDAEKEARVVNRIKAELSVDDISVQRDIALIMIVGEGMQHSIGLASRATTAFFKAGINIEMINQGSSEVSMMFGVKNEDSDNAVKALYQEFFG